MEWQIRFNFMYSPSLPACLCLLSLNPNCLAVAFTFKFKVGRFSFYGVNKPPFIHSTRACIKAEIYSENLCIFRSECGIVNRATNK